MSPDEIADCHWQILYRAEYSARYHRRRSSFLSGADTVCTLVTLAAGATAFGVLMSGSPSWLSKAGAALVTLITLAQAVLRLGSAGMMHAQWLRRWSHLYSEVSLNTKPTLAQVKAWTAEQVAIEEECVSELRALKFDCEDAAARALGIPNRQHHIWRLQRLLIHFGTFQQTFPYVPDNVPPLSVASCSG